MDTRDWIIFSLAWLTVGLVIAMCYEPVDREAKIDFSRLVAAIILWPILLVSFLIRGVRRMMTDAVKLNDE